MFPHNSVTCDFNGIALESGNTYYLDLCTTCSCEAGELNCNSKVCQELACNSNEYKGILPGDCCESCLPRLIVDPRPPCEYGEIYTDPSNSCYQCSCYYGVTACFDTSGVCSKLPTNCTQIVQMEGQCCPICNDSVDDENVIIIHLTASENCTAVTGEHHVEGETWTEEDPCTRCTCVGGKISCFQETCTILSCTFNEYKGTLPGDCCESCLPRLIVDPSPVCEQEGIYMDPFNPCNRCSCYNGVVSCLDISGQCDELPPHCEAVHIEGQCCPICQKTLEVIQQFTSPSTNCTSNAGQQREDGDAWSEDSCTKCTCEAGTINCLQQNCPELDCTYNEVSGFLPEDCCPSCLPRLIIEPPPQPPPCQQEGLFTDPVNPCLICYCHDGHTACLDSFNACDQLPTNCKQVEFITGQCCPICQDETEEEITTTSPITCTLDGQMLADGESMPQGLCSTCTCIHGQLTCDQQHCPDINCPFPEIPVHSPDQCCPSSCGPPLIPMSVEIETGDFERSAEDKFSNNVVPVVKCIVHTDK